VEDILLRVCRAAGHGQSFFGSLSIFALLDSFYSLRCQIASSLLARDRTKPTRKAKFIANKK
jgi:hypothetical protein